jgi:DNA polymerase (family 10)
LVISTDTHVLNQYDFMAYGVSVARRGWVEKKDVLNTLDVDALIRRLKSCRAGKVRRGN